MNPDIKKRIEELEPELIQTRRLFHQNPELSFQEKQTSGFICDTLNRLNIPYRDHIAGTGVAAEISGDDSGKTLLIRADMDALPIQEETSAAYRSKRGGVMHACGHDGHSAILLTLCKLLAENRDQLHGMVRLVFQPGEETSGGAKPMISSGVLEHPRVDAAIALHMDPELDCGTMRVKPGAMYASPDDFEITIFGRGGHGAQPQLCKDPIMIAAEIITQLQTIVSRRVDPFEPAVVSICSIHSGSATNVIPDTAELRGTARSMSFETRELLEDEIGKIVRQVCGRFGAEYDYRFVKLFPPLINDSEIAELLHRSGSEVLGAKNAILGGPSTMAGEDFSYFAKEVPAALFKLGCRNEEKGITAPLHNPKFDLDEACLKYGVMIFWDAVLRFLG